MCLSLPRFTRHLGLVLFATFLSGCVSHLNDYYTLVQLVLKDNSVTLSKSQLRELEGQEFIKVRVNERSSVLLQLAFNDKSDQYWRSGDGALIRMNNGVITQTDGLENDLFFTSDRQPPAGISALKQPNTWNRVLDLDGIGYGLSVTSRWQTQGITNLEVFGESLVVDVVTEQVEFPETPPYLSLNRSWQNYYYYAGDVLVATTQKLFPDGDTYDMVFLNRALTSLDNTDNS